MVNPEAPANVAELIITMNAAGQIAVNGCIENKVLAFGLMECAKEAITEHHKNAQRLVQPVHMTMPRVN